MSHKLEEDAEVDSKSLKFCHERLRSLLNTLQVANLDEFTPITKVADFVTLLGTYSQGFTIIVDPYPEAQGSSAENIAAPCSFYPSSMSGGILCKFNSILRLSEHEVSTTQH